MRGASGETRGTLADDKNLKQLDSAREEYEARRNARLALRAERERTHIRLGNYKLLVIVAGIGLIWYCLAEKRSLYWVILPVAIYIILAVWHELVLRARDAAAKAAEFYERGIARIEDRWSGTGETGERFRDPTHVYADDLDLFGRGSIFELLSQARTPMGEERLANWLLGPSPRQTILERQALVGELRSHLDLRESLYLLGSVLAGELEPQKLAAWAGQVPAKTTAALRGLCVALAFFQLATAAWWAVSGMYLPFVVILAVNIAVYAKLRERAEKQMAGLDASERALLIFSEVLAKIESENFSSSKLRDFQAQLKGASAPASRKIRKLARIVNWIDARDSLLMKIIDLPLLYTMQIGFAAGAWREWNGARVREWLGATGEMEALLSLAGYAYEHPRDPFPCLAAEDEAVFDAEQIGHPLIPETRCVRNSLHLGTAVSSGNKPARLLIVSGSNMSGKSTLLRTVGVNLVLALAGAPVRAASLRVSPLSLGTRIRSADSLQEGRSNFMTEILRIRQVCALTDANRTVLFLFDELLEGTNSHDRVIGSGALLANLLQRGAAGMVTTHDLALTQIAAKLDGAARNVHFEDQIRNGEMTFDYKLRDGIVPKSNALDLMRWIGLEV